MKGMGKGQDTCLPLLAAFILLTAFFLTQAFVAASTPMRQLYNNFSVDTSAMAGTVVDMDSRSVLYDLDRQLQIPCTLASRLMLFLLVAENFEPQQTVTISSEVAAIEQAHPTDDQVTLQTGLRVSVEFLTLRFLYYDSKAAIAALAELFNRNVDQFASLMESRALNLDLQATTFEGKIDPDNSEYTRLPYSAFSSVGDLMRLQIAILNNQRGLAYLSRGDAYLQIEADGRRIVALRSPLTDLRVQSENKIMAAYRVDDQQYALDFAYGETDSGVTVACLLLSPQEPADSQDILTLFDAVDWHYTRSRLTTRGDLVPSMVETAENGETFNLLYLENTFYTHPQGDDFLKETISYQGNPPYRLPIQPDIPTGQIVFELENGYKISVKVGPDRAILSDSGVYSRFLLALQNNPNLTAILFGAIILLCIALVFGLIRNILRAIYFFRLGGPGKRK